MLSMRKQPMLCEIERIFSVFHMYNIIFRGISYNFGNNHITTQQGFEPRLGKKGFEGGKCH